MDNLINLMFSERPLKDDLKLGELFLFENYTNDDRVTFTIIGQEDYRLLELTFYDLLSEIKSIVYVKEETPFIQIILKGGETKVSNNDEDINEGLYSNLFRFVAKHLVQIVSKDLFVNSFDEIELTQYDKSDLFIYVEFLKTGEELPHSVYYGEKIKYPIVNLIKSQELKCVSSKKKTLFKPGIEVYRKV